MTYSSGGLIQATDYNTFQGNVNTLWGTGNGANGYGQSSTLSAASAAVNIGSTEWAALVARVNSMRQHQSATAYAPTTPVAGGVITYLSTLGTTINSTFDNKLVAQATGTDSAYTNYDNATSWLTSSTREVSVTFASGDAARYFFNAGGGILINFSQISPTTTKASDWATLFSNCGTILFKASSLVRSGSGGNAPTVNLSTSGYHNLTTSYQTWLQQYSTGTLASYYNLNYVQLQVKSNGTVGANGDKGSVLTFRGFFSDSAGDSRWPTLAGDPDDVDRVTGTTRMGVAIRPPSTTYLTTNSWGTPTLAQVTNTQS